MAEDRVIVLVSLELTRSIIMTCLERQQGIDSDTRAKWQEHLISINTEINRRLAVPVNV